MLPSCHCSSTCVTPGFQVTPIPKGNLVYIWFSRPRPCQIALKWIFIPPHPLFWRPRNKKMKCCPRHSFSCSPLRYNHTDFGLWFIFEYAWLGTASVTNTPNKSNRATRSRCHHFYSCTQSTAETLRLMVGLHLQHAPLGDILPRLGMAP